MRPTRGATEPIMKDPALTLGLSAVALVLSCQSEPPPAPGGVSGSPPTAGSGGNATTAGTGPQAGSTAQPGGAGPTGGMAGGGVAGSANAGTTAGGQAGAATSGAGGGGGGGGLAPLEECQGKASVDRLTSWQASGEGLTVPATGSILVQEGDEYVGKVQFVGAEWHVIPVLIANQFGETVDLSTSAGITLTYSATSELHVQLRSESHWSGGNQYATTIASTGGQKQTAFLSFESAGWASLFGAPELSYADTLKEGMGLVFVGNSENAVVFYGMRIDGYSPPCQ